MNDLQKTETPLYLNKNAESVPCDISSNLLMAKLLGQHSKEDHSPEMKEQAEKKLSPAEVAFPNCDLVKKFDFSMWHSVGPITVRNNQVTDLDEEDSVHRTHSEEYINENTKMVYELLSRFKIDNKETISKKFLAMSSSPENCVVLRQSGCLPLLIQLIHGAGSNATVREQASQALHAMVQHNTDEKQGRREARILKLIEQILEYCENENYLTSESPAPALSTLMKLSFDVDQRHAMCQFGALYALAKIIQIEHARKAADVRNLTADDVIVRRYAAMALTNLTCGDSTNKALLCSIKPFMHALVAQLQSLNEDLCQVTAGVLRNLSWRTDTHIREALRQVEATKMLMRTVLRVQKESTLRAILAALWNLSAHGDQNKVDICDVDGAIEFLVKMLNYQAPSGSMIIIENVGGILRNISKLIAVRDDFRLILREHNCLHVLLQQLKSPSLAVVSNACGTLWNLTARSTEDQCTLIQLGAVNMLRSLTHSKHKMISIGSTAALKNLMSCRVSTVVVETNKPSTLSIRKQRALDTCDTSRADSTDDAVCDYLSPAEPKPNANTLIGSPVTPTSARECLASDQASLRSSAKSQPLNRTNCDSRYDGEEDIRKTNGFCKVEEPYNVDDTYGDYTETDLDQPTNYSLRFSEHTNTDLDSSELSVSVSADVISVDSKVSPATEDLPLETPLMFSRSSSLGSVSTCSGQADDQGSVVSEFSRAVSGIVSPSDLPDSPTQTVPPTPRPQARNSMDTFYATSDTKVRFPSAVPKDIFDDEVTVFKDECTPTLFSVATSLSSLNFDDDTYIVDGLTPVAEDRTLECKPEATSNATSSSTGDTILLQEEEKEDSLEVDLSLEEQQAILEACIVSGKPPSTQKTNSRSGTNTTSTDKNGSGEVVRVNFAISSQVSSMHSSGGTRSMFQQTLLTDSTVNYCTEDTPLSISHAASNSDLSLLCPSEDSFLQNSILPLSSCADETDVVEEQEKLLNMCIAKGKQSLSYSNHNSFDDNKSSQSSTLSEITEDLPMEDRTLIKDMAASANLISLSEMTEDLPLEDRTLIKDIMAESANLVSLTMSNSSMTDNDCPFLDDVMSKDLSEEEEKKLLNQCIALGMRSMKQDASDLENIGPPSFLAEANLDSSLTNVEEITDYPPHPAKFTPKQKRRQIKDRYNTYTLQQLSPTKTSSALTKMEEGVQPVLHKPAMIKERRCAEKDRFKTRILNKNDFEEMVKCQEGEKASEMETEQAPAATVLPLPVPAALTRSDDSSVTSESGESFHEPAKAKIVKPVVTRIAKSGIPVVASKLPKSKSTPVAKKLPPTELPVSLERQNTFTKEESCGIPVRLNSSRGGSNSSSRTTTPTTMEAAVTSPSQPFKSGIPSRIREPTATKVGRVSTDKLKSPDIMKNHRWSMSENNLNAASAVKATSNTSLNTSSTFSRAFKVSPSVSQSALPVRREVSARSVGLNAYDR